MAPTDPGTLTLPHATGTTATGRDWSSRGVSNPLAWLMALALGLLWSYWTTFLTMAERWSNDPQYSHGFLVPVFAGVVLWHRRELMPEALRSTWWGVVILTAAVCARLFGAVMGFVPLDPFSLLPALVGLALLLGGWPMLRWTWPAIAFLGFMLPLPFTIEMLLAHPLRGLATLGSTYCLQTLGLPAWSEGNIIHIDEVKLGVVEACSGLGMLMTFFALATAMAIIVQRRFADKLVIVASAIPIAVIANVARITATGVVHCSWGAAAGDLLHDWAGWLMMPLALGLLWLELRYLDRLLVDAGPPAPLAIDFTGAARALPYPRKNAEPLAAGTRSLPVLVLEKPSAPTTSRR
jgi:exosortase